jgi:hypothetical protein
MVIAGVYRRKADREPDTAARQALLERASLAELAASTPDSETK